MEKPIMIDADVLRYLVQEHLALQKEVDIAAKAAIIACEHCVHHAANMEECTTAGGECMRCKARGDCPCSFCGGRSENFEWRGVVEANVPTEEEITDFIRLLRECTSAE